jgi:hypothetical protein
MENYNQKKKKKKSYQRGSQKPKIEEEHTIEWQKEKGQKHKQRSTKH